MTASSEVWLIELTKTFGPTLAVDAISTEILGDSMSQSAPIERTKNAQGGVSEPPAQAMVLPAEGDIVAIGWNDADANM